MPIVPKQPEGYSFRCPVCGCSYFTTDGDIDSPNATGRCRGPSRGPGYGYAGCTFVWNRATQDSEVFR
jgi:hypothetical protein